MILNEKVRAAQILGADFAYMGTRFIATKESMASKEYKVRTIISFYNHRKCALPVKLDLRPPFCRLFASIKPTLSN